METNADDSPWGALETVRSQAAVAAVWRRLCHRFYAAFSAAVLQPATEPVRLYPCPAGSGYPHEVRPGRDGSFVGVPHQEDRGCGHVPLTPNDITVWELSWPKLGRVLCDALGLNPRPADLGLHNTRQVGCWPPGAVPAFMTIQDEPLDFRHAVEGLVARLPGPFILLSPTNRLVDAVSTSLLARARAGLFSLEATVLFTEHGRPQPRRAPGELFRAFTPQPVEPTDEETARRFYALASLDAGSRRRTRSRSKKDVPTVLEVFWEYCAESRSVAEIVQRHGCCKLTVLRRLKVLRDRTGVEPRDMRRYSPYLEKIREEVADARAARVRPRSLIDE
jgi:hypothetical protein